MAPRTGPERASTLPVLGRTARANQHLLHNLLACTAGIIRVVLLAFARLIGPDKYVGLGTEPVLLGAGFQDPAVAGGPGRARHADTTDNGKWKRADGWTFGVAQVPKKLFGRLGPILGMPLPINETGTATAANRRGRGRLSSCGQAGTGWSARSAHEGSVRHANGPIWMVRDRRKRSSRGAEGRSLRVAHVRKGQGDGEDSTGPCHLCKGGGCSTPRRTYVPIGPSVNSASCRSVSGA